MSKTDMLINFVPGEECRIAIIRDGRLEEFYQERGSAESHVGNIYKGKVVNVEASIQAAFVEFGLERNGFLHVSDLHPMYFPGNEREAFDRIGSKTPHRDRPPIQKCLCRGQDVLVQVLKEGIGTKGPTLTTYLSIPGRFLVMMPHMVRMGVSRKIEDDEARHQVRTILKELNPPKGFGFIIRTAGTGQTKSELKRDLAYLHRLWRNMERRMNALRAVGELYTESDLVIRTIRDVFSSEIDRIIIDDLDAARRARDFLTIASPRSRSKVVYYDDPVPLLHRFEVERQIETIHSRMVPLVSGGSLVIDQTEAVVAIDVNSGKSRSARDAETNAFRTDMEAVDEICRQLRLRDLGGVVINDLIDMRESRHRRQVEAQFRENLKRDRARTRIGTISPFGILEMTRQRMRPSLNTSVYRRCEACEATGYVKTAESVVLDVMRRLALAMHHGQVTRVELTISPDVAFRLLNRKRSDLVRLERRFGKQVMVRVGGQTLDYVHIQAFDARGGAVEGETLTAADNMAPETESTYRELGLGPDGRAGAETDGEAPEGTEDHVGEEAASGKRPSSRRRRRRRGRPLRHKSDASETDKIEPGPGEPGGSQQHDDAGTEPIALTEPETPAKKGSPAAKQGQSDAQTESTRRRKRRRRSTRPPSQSETTPKVSVPAANVTPAVSGGYSNKVVKAADGTEGS